MQDKAKESCTISFRLLHSHLKALLNNDLKGTSIEGGFERAFATLFEQDVQTFTRTMFVNLDQLEKHLSKEEFQELESSSAFRESIQERAKYKREYDKRMNDRMMQSKEGKVYSSKALDAGLVVTKSNETELERYVSSSRSGKDTHAEDADINSMNDKQPMAEVQLFAEHNIRANEQQHFEQSESVYDTYVLEKVDRNTIPKSTYMSHRGGVIDQNADDEKCQVSCPLLDLSFDNMTTKFSNQFLKSENISLKKTVAQLQKDFSRMETHCVNMELKYQNQVFKNRQHGQILNETSNKAKIKKEIEFASQVDVSNVLSKPVTPHYLPKVRESVFVRPHHVIASGSSRNSSKESYGSNDMAHNYYLEEAKKKTQDKNRNLKPREMPSARTHYTPNACTPKPRSYNQTSRNWHASKSSEETLKVVQKADHSRNPSSFLDSKHFVCLTCQKCIFNANHDACITKFMKEVNSRIRVQSPKTRNSNKPVKPKIHTQKPGRQIVTGHRFLPISLSLRMRKQTLLDLALGGYR
ncbi:hypothetical protein Tco_1417748 [Tanacetum coccineum]